jgi:L-lactate dehydrogenase complex protein LldG
MTAREEVLARLRSALSGGSAPGEPARGYRTAGDHAPGDPRLVDLLAERLEDYRATVHRCAAADIPATVATILAPGSAAGAVPVLVVPPGLPVSWRPAGVDVVPDDDLPTERLDAADGVLTGAAVAVAQTGTIVLDGSADQGRRVLTLLPDLHVCVIRPDQVVASVPEAVARLEPTRPLTWISGPSATSDIELNRVEGVHGPRRLHVVLVDGERS